MAWTDSRIFREFITDALANAVAYDLSGTGVDTFKVALFNNSITPDRDSAITGYNEATGQWLVANEVIDSTTGTDWPTAGVALASPALSNVAGGIIMFDANDTASGATADIANANGCLVYDDTLSGKPGVSFNYFGGANSVTNGTFTVVWHANGIWRITV